MSFLTRVINKQFKSIPFDIADQIYTDGADLALDTAKAGEESRIASEVERLELEWSGTHEAPYEGNFYDEVQSKLLPVAKIKRKGGQKALIETWLPRYKLEPVMINIMPHIISHIAQQPFVLRELLTTEGQIDGLKVVKTIFDGSSAWDRGLYHFLMLDSRSCYLKSQYKGDAKTYCALVPLILFAFKQYHQIPYTQWDRKTLHWVVNDSLCQAMLCDIPDDITREDILAAREQGLIYKTGAKQGEMRSPMTTYKLYSTTGTKIQGLPELAQTMLAQIWCAHPQNRTKYMVLDPRNWDQVPTPLIAENIFKEPSKFVESHRPTVSADLPWDA